MRRNFVRHNAKLFVVLALCFSMISCNAQTVEAYINLAVGIALQVAKLAGLPATTADRVSADLATVNKLVADYQAADATAKPGILAEIDTTLNVAESDLSAILTAARVVDPKLQATIQASIAIAITAVESIRVLEASKGGPVASATHATVRAAVVVLPGGGAVPRGKQLTPAQLKALYNSTVAAYPQAKLN